MKIRQMPTVHLIEEQKAVSGKSASVFAKSNGLFTIRHPGGSRGPEHIEKTGFQLPPE
jgi:hypothetical protein